MKIKNFFAAVAAFGALSLATVANANTLTFQGVTFDTSFSGSSLTLTITGANAANGDWTGAAYLNALEIKLVGGTGATMTAHSAGNWNATSLNELTANGCTGGAAGGYCFESSDSPGTPVNGSMSFTFLITGGTPDFSAPGLKVQWLNSDGRKLGTLLSTTIDGNTVPEPATLGLLGLGLAGVGFARRRKVAA